MEKQNVTCALPKRLLKRAKIFAASTDRSLTQLIYDALEQILQQHSDYEQSRRRQLRLLKAGIDLGTKGRRIMTRDQMHER